MTWSDIKAIGGYFGLGRSAPDSALERTAKERMKQLQGRTVVEVPKVDPTPTPPLATHPPSITAKVTAVGTAVAAAAAGVNGAKQLYDSVTTVLPTEAIKKAVDTTVSATADTLKSAANNTASAAASATATASKVSEVVVEGGSDLLDWAKFGWSWGSWGFNLMPPSVKVLVGLGGLYFAYTLFRSNRSGNGGNSTVNVHLNIAPMSSEARHCRVIQSERKGPNGKEVHVDLDCSHQTQAAPVPVPQEPLKSRKDKVDSAVKKMLKSAEKVHKKLLDHHKHQGELVSPPVKAKMEELIASFNQIKAKKYKDGRVMPLIVQSYNLMPIIDAEVKSKTKEAIEKTKSANAATS